MANTDSSIPSSCVSVKLGVCDSFVFSGCSSPVFTLLMWREVSTPYSASSGQVTAAGSGMDAQARTLPSGECHCQTIGPSGCLLPSVSSGKEATAASDASGNYDERMIHSV